MRLLQLRPGEGAPVGILVGWYFCVVGVTFVLRSVRDALFLGHLSAAALPAMFIIAPISVTIVGLAYSRLDGVIARDRMVLGVTALSAALLVATRLALGHVGDWIYYALYVLADVISGLTIMQLWVVAGDRFTARAAKRIFGLIGAGGTIAGIAFGAVLAGMSSLLSPENLLYVCAALLAITIALARGLRRISPAEKKKSAVATSTSSAGAGHLKYIGLALICATFVTTLVDFQFKAVTAESFGADRTAMVAFFGKMSVANSLLSLAIQLFAIRLLLGRLGVVGGLLVLPFALAGGEVALAIVPTLVVATVLKSADQVFRYTLNDAATQLVFLPVPSRIRGKWKAVIDNAYKPLSQLALGLALLGYRAAVPSHPIWPLVIVALVMSAVWISVIVKLRGAYTRSLRDTLRARPPELDEGIDAVPQEELAALRATLGSDDPVEVLAALELAVTVDDASEPISPSTSLSGRVTSRSMRARLIATVAPLTKHPDARIRRAAYIALIHLAGSAQTEPVTSTTRRERAVEDRAHPLAFERNIASNVPVTGAAESEADPEVREAMLAFRIARGDRSQLSCGAIAIAARGWLVPPAELVDYVERGLRERAPDALDAAEALGSPELVEPLLAMGKRAPIAAALAACGAGAERQLDAHLTDTSIIAQSITRSAIEGSSTSFTKIEVIRALGMIASPASIAILVDHLANPPTDGTVESERIMTALARALGAAAVRSPDAPIDRARVRAAIVAECRGAYRAMAAAEGLGREESSIGTDGVRTAPAFAPDSPDGASAIMSKTLRDRQDRHRDRAFALLAALYPRARIDELYKNTLDSEANRRANAVELLESSITSDRELRTILVPLVEESPRYMKVAAMAARFDLPRRPDVEWISELLADKSPWMLACASYYAGVMRFDSVKDRLRELARHPDATVRESATLAASHLP